MKTAYRLLLILIVVGFTALNANAQTNPWSPNYNRPSTIAADKSATRLSLPKEFKLFNLDIAPLRQQLFSIVDTTPLPHSTIIFLPNAEGGYEQFQVFEA